MLLLCGLEPGRVQVSAPSSGAGLQGAPIAMRSFVMESYCHPHTSQMLSLQLDGETLPVESGRGRAQGRARWALVGHFPPYLATAAVAWS